jgi:hypothetical protein
MSKKRTKYTSAFKTKLALELLQNESTIVQIFSKQNIIKHSHQKKRKNILNHNKINICFIGSDLFLFSCECLIILCLLKICTMVLSFFSTYRNI